MVDYSKQNKRNRAVGSDTERRVKADLESKGWIVSKWNNNVNLKENKLCVVKNKFRDVGIPMMLGAGFPDFLAFRRIENNKICCEVIGVECKANGQLDKTEKEKCKWILDNDVFSKILIASRDKVKNRIQINYKNFEVKKSG